ncbi:hypothetical protein BHM03_00018959 [Ensete ventricosum]|nr:hypothetical protein BHM03_00018959 [Ensete ventricosum]
MAGMAGYSGREERNRGGRRRKRRPRGRAAVMCGCYGKKEGEEEQRGQGGTTACVGKMGKTVARPAVSSSRAAEFGEGCGRGERQRAGRWRQGYDDDGGDDDIDDDGGDDDDDKRSDC